MFRNMDRAPNVHRERGTRTAAGSNRLAFRSIHRSGHRIATGEQPAMIQAGSITEPATEMRPIAGSERIQALDVVRGFALIGIFLMNIEWFNRPIAELGTGIPPGAQGGEWLAG